MRFWHVSIWIKIPVLVVLLSTAWVWQRVSVVKMIRTNSQLSERVAAKRETSDKLAATISQLRQRERITATVGDVLHLEPASPGQVHALVPAVPAPPDARGSGWQRFGNGIDKLVALSSLGGQ